MRFILLAITLFFGAGCVTTANRCGNEQRDWNTLTFPKARYCSVPGWIPFASAYERANRAVCKVHDNNSGIRSTMTAREADYRFLCDYLKHSDFPWGVKHVTGYLSYVTLRISAPTEDVTPVPDFGLDPIEGTRIEHR